MPQPPSDAPHGDQRRQWELAFEHTTRGISLTDPGTGRLASVNAAFATMHGGTAADFAGRPYASLLTEEDARRLPGLTAQVARTGYATFECEHVRLDGTRFPVRSELVSTPRGDGSLTYRIGFEDDLTIHRAVEASERRASERFRTAFDHAPIGMAVFERERLVEVNEALCRMLGREPDDLIRRSPLELTHPDDRARAAEYLRRLADGELETVRLRKRYLHADGSVVWARLTIAAVEGTRGSGLRLIAQIADVTRELRVMDERADARRLFATAFESAPIGMALVALDGTILEANAALCRLLGYDLDDLLDRPVPEITHPEDRAIDEHHAAELLATGAERYELEKRCLTSSGDVVWVQVSVAAVRDRSGVPLHFVCHIQDVSQRREREDRLVHLADHDDLTDLHNRRRFEIDLTQQVERCRRYGECAALLLLDLDRLKDINDTHGHAAGDAAIRHVARVLGERLRRADVLARLGGDEFAVILPRVTGSHAAHVATDLIETLAASPLDLEDVSLTLNASVGVAVLSGDTADAADTRARADAALYEAKAAGRGRAALDPLAAG